MMYKYQCNGQTKILRDDQETIVVHREYFLVHCEECANIGVVHLLERMDDAE